MTANLTIHSSQIHKVDHPASDLWIELDARGEYADMSSREEQEVLDELRLGPWREVVRRRYAQSRTWLYDIITDPQRSAFLKVLPLAQRGNFLDVGSGWGQEALPMSDIGNVFCLDLTMPRLNILMEIAEQEKKSLNYICGNFRTFPFETNQFDAVIFNGSLEYTAVGTSGTSVRNVHREVLMKANKLLKTGGVLYIGIENSMGLKYLLGAPDDHVGIPYITFLDEQEAQALYAKHGNNNPLRIRTWSLQEYKSLLDETSFDIVEIYGCFPDYKLIRAMIPLHEINSRLMKEGMPHPEHSGVDGSLLSQNELLPSLYRALAENGVAQNFCPSFGIVGRAR